MPVTDNQPESSLTSGDQPLSVSDWVCSLKDGDAEAAQQLWNRYFEKLVAQAGQRVRSHNCPEGTIVPEDVAASVFESLWKGANAGRFEKVTDRRELWRLLQAMTRRKVVSHIRYSTAQQRFPGVLVQRKWWKRTEVRKVDVPASISGERLLKFGALSGSLIVPKA